MDGCEDIGCLIARLTTAVYDRGKSGRISLAAGGRDVLNANCSMIKFGTMGIWILH